MSTNDVPGANPANRDVLAAGCWAEHSDGSLLFVEGNEGDRVVYSMFDMSKDPILEYRDAMAEVTFKKAFSWRPSDPKSEKWVWHDKTPFPWDKIITKGASDGVRLASAEAVMTAADRVATSLRLRGTEYSARGGARLVKAARTIGDKFSRAINELRQ